MVTSDFICPSTTLDVVPGGLDLRGSVRVWNFKQRKILRTVNIQNAVGTIDVKLIPGDEWARAYTAGMIDDHLYLIDTVRGTAQAVFDFSTIAPGGWATVDAHDKRRKTVICFDEYCWQGCHVRHFTSIPTKSAQDARSRC